VCGKVSGRLVEAPRINDLTAPFDEPMVALLEKVEGEEEIPSGVAGMVVAHAIPRLSHIAVRARQGEVVFAVCEDADRFAELRHLVGKRVVLDVSAQEVNPGISGDTRDRGASDRQGKIGHKHLKVPDVILSSSDLLISLNQVTLATGGSKADGARELEKMSKIQTAGFRTPLGLVVPFGVMEESLHCAPALEQEFRGLVNQLNEQPQNDFLKALKRLQDITGRLSVPQEIVSGVLAKFPPSHRLIVRSSANCEDLEGLSAAGLYDSVANLSPSEVAQGVSKVWASLWTRRAAMNRKKLNIPHDRAHMAVLIQQMLVPEFSFIMHTVNPINYDRDELYVELAVGLGQTLASGKAPGVPYRMVCHKYTGEVRMLAFASFSHALWSDLVGNLMGKTIDYSKIELSRDGAFRDRLGSRLGAIGRFVEDSLGRPQDIEGLVLGEEIYLVQARPQCVRP
jgi:phosphoglucan,water dikinase